MDHAPTRQVTFLPITRMRSRLDTDKHDSDTTWFYSLLLYGELIAKLATLALAANINDDRERTRYRVYHRIVRADGIGEWADILDYILTGPPAQIIPTSARPLHRQFTQKVSADAWQNKAIRDLLASISSCRIEVSPQPTKPSLQSWFRLFALFRNKTRGHGAVTPTACANAALPLHESIESLAHALECFRIPWAHLKRNLSGKYRVSTLGGVDTPFQPFRSRSDLSLTDGVYLATDVPREVPLAYYDPDSNDLFVPNGSFSDKSFEILSYFTGDTRRSSSDPYLSPAQTLPQSSTSGIPDLTAHAECFSNLPPSLEFYIPREDLESELRSELVRETHPIVTLDGPGGIGKTSLALRVLHSIADAQDAGYTLILWLSARDIDLLESGPKTVQPSGVSLLDFANEAQRLVGDSRAHSSTHPIEFLSTLISSDDLGRVLIVLDNFETVANTAEIFRWFDEYLRPPNKLLITTRNRRDFRGDFQIPVGGMTDFECALLINQTAARLSIDSEINDQYVEELIRESAGHPYVIKVLLGEVAKARSRKKIERLVASRDDILQALFERTYNSLSPAAQRVFLTLCNWKSVVLEMALHAVVIRPGNENMDVSAALDELRRSSLVNEIWAEKSDQSFLYVPLVASVFGRQKLTTSPWKAFVEADSQILHEFGAAQTSDTIHGIQPRIERFFQSAAQKVAEDRSRLDQYVGIMEFIARRAAPAWLLLADFYEELGDSDSLDKAKLAIRRFLQVSDDGDLKSRSWNRLSQICERTNDDLGRLSALVEMAANPSAPIWVVSSAANRINAMLYAKGTEWIEQDEMRILIQSAAESCHRRRHEMDATGLSRSAWLHLHLQEEEIARSLVEQGLRLDQDNDYCLRLFDRLESST